MSIVLYSGIPGSGKTYRVMYDICKKEIQDKYTIFHNIKGCTLDGDYIHNWTSIPGFLTRRKQEEICAYEKENNNRSVLVVVDEAHMEGFDKASTELKGWLSWHRHLGQDIWLICQSPERQLHRDYLGLPEYEVRGKKGAILNSFVYQYRVAGESYRTERIKKDPQVFAAYRSFDQAGAKKKGSRLVLYIGVASVAAVCVLVYSIGWGMPSTFRRAGGEAKSKMAELKGRPSVLSKSSEKVKVVPGPLVFAPVAEYRACMLLGDRISLCDAVGHVRPYQEIYPGARVHSVTSDEVRLVSITGVLMALKVGRMPSSLVSEPATPSVGVDEPSAAGAYRPPSRAPVRVGLGG
jgi:hypothetical protein